MEAALYCVATPIGNLGDITRRAVDVLSQVDWIYAEDTRVTRKLLTHLGIAQQPRSLHDHNEQGRIDEISAVIANGESVALVSDAGTPLISDPGFHLVSALRKQDIKIIPVPGVSAVITALSAAGLPTDRFAFEGFLPAKSVGRQKALQAIKDDPRTLVFYESSHRIEDLLEDILFVVGNEREIVIARELTKLYEQFYRGTATSLLAALQEDSNMRKGEFVVMMAGAEVADVRSQAVLGEDKLLAVLVGELPVKQAAKIAAQLTGQAKNTLYRQAMALSQKL